MHVKSILASAAMFASATSAANLCSAVKPYSYTVAATTHPEFVSAIDELKKHPVGSWYTDRQHGDQVDELMKSCNGDIPVIVIYGLPNKDCGAGGYSNGGSNKNAGDYAKWIESLYERIGNKEVIYVVEPDAVGLLAGNDCAKEHGYMENVKMAIATVGKNANAKIYIDVASWAQQDKAVAVLKELQTTGHVTGIAINTSNYKGTAEMEALCQSYSSATGGLRCVIDTSRNNNGSPQNEWCNAKSAGMGAPPTASTGSKIVDYYVWLKVPGESDGECTDKDRSSDSRKGPAAGLFFAEGFKSLWDQSYFVKSQGLPAIGEKPNNGSTSAPTSAPSQLPSPGPSPSNYPTPDPSPSTAFPTPGPSPSSNNTVTTHYPTPAPSPSNYPTPAPWTDAPSTAPSSTYPTPAPSSDSVYPTPAPSSDAVNVDPAEDDNKPEDGDSEPEGDDDPDVRHPAIGPWTHAAQQPVDAQSNASPSGSSVQPETTKAHEISVQDKANGDSSSGMGAEGWVLGGLVAVAGVVVAVLAAKVVRKKVADSKRTDEFDTPANRSNIVTMVTPTDARIL